MPIRLTTTSYGTAAYDALRAAVHEAKGGDPLHPVTVVVPAERVGVAARRALARGDAERGPGIAALSILTLRRLAEVLAAPELLRQGRRPITSPALAHAVRAELDASPDSPFTPVAGHIGTVRALAEAHRDLRPHDHATKDGLAGEPVADETVRCTARSSFG